MRGDAYALSSGTATLTALIAVLGRTTTDNVFDLLQANAETLIKTGAELARDSPRPAEFWNRVEPR